jgi:hypothetical protein
MDPSNLCCLRNGPFKLKLLTVWTHQLVNTVKNVGFMGPYPKQHKLDVSML